MKLLVGAGRTRTATRPSCKVGGGVVSEASATAYGTICPAPGARGNRAHCRDVALICSIEATESGG